MKRLAVSFSAVAIAFAAAMCAPDDNVGPLENTNPSPLTTGSTAPEGLSPGVTPPPATGTATPGG